MEFLFLAVYLFEDIGPQTGLKKENSVLSSAPTVHVFWYFGGDREGLVPFVQPTSDGKRV